MRDVQGNVFTLEFREYLGTPSASGETPRADVSTWVGCGLSLG